MRQARAFAWRWATKGRRRLSGSRLSSTRIVTGDATEEWGFSTLGPRLCMKCYRKACSGHMDVARVGAGSDGLSNVLKTDEPAHVHWMSGALVALVTLCGPGLLDDHFSRISHPIPPLLCVAFMSRRAGCVSSVFWLVQ